MGTLWETYNLRVVISFLPSLERYVASYQRDQTMDETRNEINLTPLRVFFLREELVLARYDRWQHVLAVEVNFDYRIQRSTGPGVKMKGSQNNARTVTKRNLSGVL